MPRSRKKKSNDHRVLWLVCSGLLGLALYAGTHFNALREQITASATAAAPVSGPSRKLLESRESLYNNIYVFAEGNNVAMSFGYNRRLYTESLFNTLDDRALPLAYTRFMTASLIYPKNIHSILEIGFGGGRTAWYLHRFLPDVPITSVELDPQVVALSHKYFGIRDEPNFRVVQEDGRTFLSHTKNHYDVIMIDAYRGPFVPFHLLTREFYQIVKDHLAEGGVVAQNIEPTTMLFDSAVTTIRSVFPQLDFYLADQNVVTIAYDGDRIDADELERMADERQAQLHMRYDLRRMLAQRRLFVAGAIDPKAKILTDDFAPVESLKAIEAHNRKWQAP